MRYSDFDARGLAIVDFVHRNSQLLPKNVSNSVYHATLCALTDRLWQSTLAKLQPSAWDRVRSGSMSLREKSHRKLAPYRGLQLLDFHLSKEFTYGHSGNKRSRLIIYFRCSPMANR